jgi:hypothetical protein
MNGQFLSPPALPTVAGLAKHKASLDAVYKKVCCLCRKSNPDSLAIHPAARRYSDSF